jgi:hypothetical protein
VDNGNTLDLAFQVVPCFIRDHLADGSLLVAYQVFDGAEVGYTETELQGKYSAFTNTKSACDRQQTDLVEKYIRMPWPVFKSSWCFDKTVFVFPLCQDAGSLVVSRKRQSSLNDDQSQGEPNELSPGLLGLFTVFFVAPRVKPCWVHLFCI